MNPVIKNIAAVIVGWLGGSIVNMGLIQTGHNLIPIKGIDPNDMNALAAVMPTLEIKYFIFPFLAHALGTLTGAAIAGLIAANHKMKFSLGIGGLFLLGGIMVNYMLPGPTWFAAADIVIAYIPMAWIGGKIAMNYITILKMLRHQHWHVLILSAMLCSLYFYVGLNPTILEGELWGLSTLKWSILAILSPIVHQLYVLVCWRYELYHKGISRLFGSRGFTLYKVGFAILILSRPVTITLLAISNAMTVDMNPAVSYVISGILLIPAVYLFYSVAKYFGMNRAFGIDHFYPEEYKSESFVKQGIFKYTGNGMYIYGFFVLWIPGVLLQSEAALALALFNHLYIWVHYYFTELPDIRVIYEET